MARGLSNYIDALAANQISVTFRAWLPMDVSFLSQYPDLLAFLLVLVLTGKMPLKKCMFALKSAARVEGVITQPAGQLSA